MFGDSLFFDDLVKRQSGEGNSTVYVVLHSTNGVGNIGRNEVECSEPLQISTDMWLCRLPKSISEAVYDACESPGSPPVRAARQYGQLYSIAVFNGPWKPGQFSGERDAEINTFVSCAQLVHQTTLGFANSARLDFDPQGALLEARPHACRGITEQAFLFSESRNWLSQAEAWKARDLYKIGFMHLGDRVKRANWLLQHSFFQYFVEVRTILMVTGLEALLHARIPVPSGKRGIGSEKQFVGRSTSLARLLGVDFAKDDAAYVYAHRSDISHGRDPWATRLQNGPLLTERLEISDSEPVVRMCLKAENLLRAAIIQSIEDPSMARIFDSDASVASRLPVS